MPHVDTATEVSARNNPSFNFYPNLVVPVDPSGCPFLLFWPTGDDTMRIECHWFAPDYRAEEAHPLWPTRIANFDRILDEDLQFAEQIQKSVESPGFRGMTLNYQERRIYHWHEELDRRIQRAGVEVAAVEEGMDDDFISYDRTLQTLKRHPDIQGIYAVAAGIRGLGKALGESGGAGGVRVVCNDLVPETTKLIAEGVIDASIVQDPISQGRLAVKILFDCLFEGRGPLREVYYTYTGIVTKHLL
jgi:hypothetical protein